MSRREWYFWGYVLWMLFGLLGVILVLAPYRMGLSAFPSWPFLVGGFIAGLIAFVLLNLKGKT